jgi:hypothetical protein
MWPLIIVFFLGACSAVGSTIGAKDTIFDFSKRGIGVIRNSGWFFLPCTIAPVFLVLAQTLMQNATDAKKEHLQKIQEDIRDSTLRASYEASVLRMKKEYDTSNRKTLDDIAEILGKYGYRLDSVNRKLVKLIADSANMKVVLPEDPVLCVADNNTAKGISYLKDDGPYSHYALNISSLDAGSCCFDIKASVVVLNDVTLNYDYIPVNFSFPETNTTIPKNSSTGYTFKITNKLKYHYLYLWIRGVYKNVSGTKTYNFNEVYYNNKNGNVFGTMLGETKQQIIKTINYWEK